ncbi:MULTISPECIES: mandelate racemase/muconate lactonizing enzyme family protein [unclassified Beijerinckia]|uniref:mandelate racemase/muconate lactonizing enzyme family protein n=1 Tax=unclassified Beijerinckia TaxID=2638183 RepID=UPI00089B2732|nr:MULTISPECIES: mandelate racemase/muconate lactonizing enzyme family protein [unclassified Beijerinckia]MDH7796769.1 galactonate dehydratase [Beijerinckia sp. GAS462]SEC59076.1 L-alanine-DL-glutamate epimerase [Beijerinckia sp. 28-YEA-48]
MKIVKLEQFHADMGWRPASFLKITTDEGLVGWAEYAENFGAGGVSDLLRRFAPIIQGLDPREVGKLTASLQAITRLAAGGLNNQAIAAIENACLDIKAKALGVPVYALFGGPFRTRLPVYWSHCGSFRVRFADLFESWGKPRIETLDDLKTLGQEATARGFTAIKTNPLFQDGGKLKMFEGGFRLYPKLLERNIDSTFIGAITDMLAAFREGLGPQTGLMLDINFSQRTEGFLRIARALEPFDLTWFEIDMHDPQALAHVRRSSRVPIASLESIHGLRGYRPYFEEGAADVAVVDVPWNGLWESVRIATLADAYEVNCAPHNFYGTLASIMSAHFCAAIPNFRIMELEVDDVPWRDEFVTVPPTLDNGEFVLPTGPGWGTEVNEEALRARPWPRR